MKKLIDDFKGFAFKGNVIDMAVGVIIGGAFGKIVTSLVSDIFMPLLGLVTGGVSTRNLFIPLKDTKGILYETFEAANAAGIGTFNYGAFLQNIIDFLLIALCIFLFVKGISGFKKQPAPAKTVHLCPYCRTQVDQKATRCPQCTSDMKPEETII